MGLKNLLTDYKESSGIAQLPNGYIVEPNSWGAFGTKYRSTVYTKDNLCAWTWNDNDDPTGKVLAYLEVRGGGIKPFDDSKYLPDPDFASAKINETKNCFVDYSWQAEGEDSFNTAIETWALSEAGGGRDKILAEIMYWPYTQGSIIPAGAHYRTIDNHEYWIARASLACPWDIYTVRCKNIVQEEVFDFMPVLHFLADSYKLDLNAYFGSVEMGNEVLAGRGTTLINRFSVKRIPL